MQETIKAISSKLTAPEQAKTRRTLVIGAIIVGAFAVILATWYFMYRNPSFEPGRPLTLEEKMKLIEKQGGASPIVLSPKQKELIVTQEAQTNKDVEVLTLEQKMEIIRQSNAQ